MEKHNVIYNSQRDNFNFKGKFPVWKQCFSTCAFMFISFFNDTIFGDKDLVKYIDDVEAQVGEPGIAEKVIQKFKWITGFTSMWWLVQKEGIEKWLWRSGIQGEAVYVDKGHWQDIIIALDYGPIILGTDKMGGLPNGHIILLIGTDNDAFIVHDPFGNATTKYVDINGDAVRYPIKYLIGYAGDNPRYMYWKSK